jgi:site-specific DNA-methyltransferase (adenine-specific)
MWLYGSGFPKSMNVSKAIDKALGAEREVVGMIRKAVASMGPGEGNFSDDQYKWKPEFPITSAATAAAAQWDGWGTALKPAWEPIILARKPLTQTVAANVQEFGTGAMNIDGCRIELHGDYKAKPNGRPSLTGLGDNYDPDNANQPDTVGRWPANLILDEEAGAILDEQTGTLKSGTGAVKRATGAGYQANAFAKESRPGGTPNIEYGDSGGASRFFYCPKASKKDRGAGNTHPTVKPQALMRYLCRLITPPGGTILDPFCGSGTTCLAARAEGFGFIGIERELAYARIALERLGAGQVSLATEETEQESAQPTTAA